jgi:2'-5' RNA ligase
VDHIPLGENACIQKGGIMRSFIAVELEKNLIEKVHEIQTRITEGKIKFVEPENLHFTLKFLGEITEKKVQDVSTSLKEVCSSVSPFTIYIRNVGVFPSLNYIKVIWVGTDSTEFLTLSQSVDSSMAELGFRKERNITPHLTIGRVKAPGNKARLQDQIKTLADTNIGEMEVSSVVLKRSELTRKGPIYSDIEEITL